MHVENKSSNNISLRWEGCVRPQPAQRNFIRRFSLERRGDLQRQSIKDSKESTSTTILFPKYLDEYERPEDKGYEKIQRTLGQTPRVLMLHETENG